MPSSLSPPEPSPRPNDSCEDQGPVPTGQVDGDIEPQATQGEGHTDLIQEPSSLTHLLENPLAVHASRHLKHLPTGRAAHGMKLGAWIIASQIPQCRHQVDRVPKEAGVDHEHPFGAAGLPEKTWKPVHRHGGCAETPSDHRWTATGLEGVETAATRMDGTRGSLRIMGFIT